MKYFIVYSNGPSPEDYSVFYSTLVIAEDEKSAIEKYCVYNNNEITPEEFNDDENGYGIQEFRPIQ